MLPLFSIQFTVVDEPMLWSSTQHSALHFRWTRFFKDCGGITSIYVRLIIIQARHLARAVNFPEHMVAIIFIFQFYNKNCILLKMEKIQVSQRGVFCSLANHTAL
jgi:hypothetical protein